MGKGTKHKCDWKPTVLQTAIDARRLYAHTVKIMQNPKVFKPERDFKEETLKHIQRTAMTIYLDVWTANRMNAVQHPEMADRRLALQSDALEKCREMLALEELAKEQFHVASPKFWNWVRMTWLLGIRIDAWHKSDLATHRGASADKEASPAKEEVAVG